jgi:ParB-like chromosome segregation protein Spo0J
VRDADTEDADRAIENIARKQLNPYEEARAVAAMLARGLTEDGAAQALGWPKARVSARVKMLELPERAQQLLGAGVIALDRLRAIGAVAPELLDAVIAYLDDGNEWAAERLAREPGWVLDSAMRHGNSKAFAAYLHSVSAHEISELRLGKKTEQLYAKAEKQHRQLDRYAYGPPPVRFIDADVDQARAAGVLIEFDRGRPIIVDRSMYRELVKGAIKRTADELDAKAAATAKEKQAQRAGKAPADPLTVAKRERDAQLRELADQAHGANLDLGVALLGNLATVDPADMTVARFFCFALLGSDYDARRTRRPASGSSSSRGAASG